MKQLKKSILRHATEEDIERGFVHYLENAGNKVAAKFVDAVDATLRHIEQFPRTGSPRYGELFNTPGLRSWLVDQFPFTLFYIERNDHLDVIRLLHQHSDIPQQLQNDISNMEL